MNEFYRQDIFFFVTTVAVVILGLLLAILGIYLIKIMKDVKYITKRAKTESDLLAEDFNDLRQNIREKRLGLKAFGSFLSRLAKRRNNKS